MERNLHNTDATTAAASTPDIKTTGDRNTWVLICKASSEKQGWMKSTKAMNVPGGVLVLVTTEHRRTAEFPDPQRFITSEVTACAETMTFIPNASVEDLREWYSAE